MTKHIFPFENHEKYSEGIDTRDYVALIAMQGICANPAYSEARYDQVAEMAYGYADALIKKSKEE